MLSGKVTVLARIPGSGNGSASLSLGKAWYVNGLARKAVPVPWIFFASYDLSTGQSGPKIFRSGIGHGEPAHHHMDPEVQE